MKIKSQSNKKKIAIVALLLVAILVAAAGAYYYITSRQNSSTQNQVNLSPATEEEKKAGDQSKDQTVNDTSSNSSKNNPTDPSTPATSTNLPMRISASSQNGSVYQIRTIIDGIVANGTCKLVLTKDSQTVTKTAATQALAQSSTCQGFDVPTSELSPGTWQVALSFTSEATTGSTTGSIEVK